LNWGHPLYKSGALPTELRWHKKSNLKYQNSKY
jgi:hypothetical protein